MNFSSFGVTSRYLGLPVGVSVSSQALTVIVIGQARSSVVSGTIVALHSTGNGAIITTGLAASDYYFGMFNAAFKKIGIINASPSVLALTSSASAVNAYQNDRVVGTAAAYGSTTWSNGFIGNGLIGNGSSYDIQAIIVVAAALTQTQITAIQRAAYAQFNVKPQLKNRIVVAGDSIVFGQVALVNGQTGNLSGVNFVREMQAQLLPYEAEVFNMGTPSQTMQYIAANPTQYFQGLAVAGQNNIVIFEAVTNDLAASRTPAQVYADLTTAVNAARANGFQYVGVCTCLPRSTLNNNTRQAYNALVYANAVRADFIIDFGGDPDMGSASAHSNTNLYHADGTHPTPLGHAYLGSIAANTVRGFLVKN